MTSFSAVLRLTKKQGPSHEESYSFSLKTLFLYSNVIK